MELRELGRTGLKVSSVCLGTMTFGRQNTEADAHAQLDAAVAAGVNFIDTAEVYPVPNSPETCGDTERFIGTWLAARGGRERLVLATKVSGPAAQAGIANARKVYNAAAIAEAIDASLQRLRTDWIDLYQVHWPSRRTNFFGRLGYPGADAEEVPIEETLGALADAVQAGKIRHFGVSNETPWGVARYLHLAADGTLPRVASIQNPYNLLNRSFEIGLSEYSEREAVGLLAYSPLGFGVLTGKYRGGQWPEGARLTLWGEQLKRYLKPRALAATGQYLDLAAARGISPVQLALGFVTSRPLVTSNIIGATSVAQLQENIAACAFVPDAELEAAIEAIHAEYPNPAP